MSKDNNEQLQGNPDSAAWFHPAVIEAYISHLNDFYQFEQGGK